MTTLASIIIPSNSRPCLAEVLASIRRSGAATPYEVIVVGELPPGLPLQEPRERLVPCHGLRTGPMRNLAVREARGDLLLFTDSDCIVDADWIDRAAAACTPENPVVAGGIRFPENNACDCGDNLAIFRAVHVSCKPGPRPPWGIGTNNLAVHRDLFDRVGGFDANLSSGEDAEFLHRAATTGCGIRFDPSFAVLHQSNRNTPALVRDHARWYAEGTTKLLRDGMVASGGLRADTLVGWLPGGAALWSAFTATAAVLGFVLPHPPFWRLVRAWPWAWWFLYNLRREKFRCMRAARKTSRS